MTSRDFCYWLQGFLEIRAAGCDTIAGQPRQPGLTPEQLAVVQAHLSMVFAHEIDPAFANGPKLDALHKPLKTDAVARC